MARSDQTKKKYVVKPPFKNIM